MSVPANMPPYRGWTEGQWFAAEQKQQELRDKWKPTCPRCGTKPSDKNGYEEEFCKCGATHFVSKKEDRINENQITKKFRE